MRFVVYQSRRFKDEEEKKTSLDKEAIPNDFLFHQLPQQSHILFYFIFYWDCFKEVEITPERHSDRVEKLWLSCG
jgi:hypothetical protein